MKFIKIFSGDSNCCWWWFIWAKFLRREELWRISWCVRSIQIHWLKEGNVYVKTKKADSVNGYGIV